MKWGLSFAGLSTLPGTPEEDAMTSAAIIAEMDLRETRAVAAAGKKRHRLMGRSKRTTRWTVVCGPPWPSLTTVGGCHTADLQSDMRSREPVLRQAMERQARREVPVQAAQSGVKASTPPQSPTVGRKGTPASTLLRHGLIALYPMPVGVRSDLGRRYRSTVAGCWSILWDGSTWAEPEVEALRQAVVDQDSRRSRAADAAPTHYGRPL